MAKWWAVYCIANKEPLADLNLRRRGFKTYFPHERIAPRWQGIPKSKTLSELVSRRPHLPRYLFVETLPGRLAEVNDTMGVSTVVYAPGGSPFPIEFEVIQALRKRLEPRANGPLRKPRFAGVEGQDFRFGESSPLFGFYAAIVRLLDNDKIIARLRSTLFGAAGREVEVPVSDVGELLPIESNNG